MPSRLGEEGSQAGLAFRRLGLYFAGGHGRGKAADGYSEAGLEIDRADLGESILRFRIVIR